MRNVFCGLVRYIQQELRVGRKMKFKVGLVCLLAVASLSAEAALKNAPFVWNDANAKVLGSIACAGFAEKTLTLHGNERQFYFHSFRLLKPENGKLVIEGECNIPVGSDMKRGEGSPLQLTIDTNAFDREANPVLEGSAGTWGFKFYFRTTAEFDGAGLLPRKILNRYTLFHIGPAAMDSKWRKVPLVLAALQAAEDISPAKLSFSGSWNNPIEQQLPNLEGLGERWLIAFRLWQFEENLYVNVSDLVSYWGQGRGHPSGNVADGVFYPLFPGSNTINGCTNILEFKGERISAEKCRELWLRTR